MPKSLRAFIKRIPYARATVNLLRPARRDAYSEKITSDAHNNVVLTSDGIPIPPIRLRDMVRRGAILAEDFVLEGAQVHQTLHRVAEETGNPISRTTRIFEFGVGCGRVARHFLSEGFHSFTGTDVDDELVSWCESNLRNSETPRFLQNNYQPPLPLKAACCDLAYAISIFTHMDLENQKMWALEMGRVLQPGGLLVISFLERSAKELPKGIEVVQRIDPEYSRSWFGKGGAPNFYFDTYNTKDHLSKLFSKDFQLIAYHNRIIRNHQSMLVLQRGQNEH